MAAIERVLRRYDLPPAAVRAATERRLAGDWRGACAAAGVEVDATVDAAVDAPGSRLLDDLRHLVPDLLRWHLLDENVEPVHGAWLPVLLTRDAATGRALLVSSRHRPYGPPRLILSMAEAWRPARWDSSQHLWDARHTDRLRERLGGGERTPYFRRDGRPLHYTELPRAAPPREDRAACAEWEDHQRYDDRIAGWRAVGVQVDPAVPALLARPGALYPAASMSRVLTAVEDLLRGGTPSDTALVVQLGGRPELALTLTLHPGGDPVLRVAEWERAQHLPAVPTNVYGMPWFFYPLRSGRLPVSAVHPLVRAALFPDAPDEPYTLAAGVRVPERIHVQCSGRHYVGWRDGRLEPLNHTPDDLHRERTLQSLGGRSIGCLTVLDAWTARTGRLPRQIRTVTHQMFLAAVHGDAAEVHRLLDAGVDPRGVRGPQRVSLLHVAQHIGDLALIRRLRAAGVDPLTADNDGRSAVRAAEMTGAPGPILDALREHAGTSAGSAVGTR